MRRTAHALACAALLLGACAQEGGPRLDVLDSTPPPTLVPPPAPEPERFEPAEGSLWRGEESRRLLAFENRARRVGDVVTVLIEESARAKNEASTDLERQSTTDASLDSDIALQTLITRPVLNLLNLLGFTDLRSDGEPSGPVDIVSASTDADFEGKGKLERKASFATTVACMVTDVTSSGLLRVEGTRNLTINRETQVIRIAGYVRPEDVRIDNTVPSALIASADIYYSGVGVLSEDQRPPWLQRIFKLVTPF
jgi:flagellar L-ring protein precursor FlgH